MTARRRGPFREEVLERLAGANQDIAAPLVLASRGGLARAALALLLAGALPLVVLPWVPLQVEAQGRLVEGAGGRIRFVGRSPLDVLVGARARIVVAGAPGSPPRTLAGHVVVAGGEVRDLEVELEAGAAPGPRASCRLTVGRASPLELLARGAASR